MTDLKEKEKQYTEEQKAAQKTALAVQVANRDFMVQAAGNSILMNPAYFDQAQRVAKIYADSDLVPDHFQRKTSNVFVALELAERLGVNPFMLMQNLYVVHGKPGMEAKLVIALINQRGPFTGPVQWKFSGEGDTRACTAFATLRATGKTVESTVDWDMVVKEGWLDKKGSKWKTMPTQMFQYRSAAFLARLYCPEVTLGIQTVDETEDAGNIITATIEPENADVPAFESPAEPPPDPAQPPAATPSPPVETTAPNGPPTGTARSLDELTARAARIGIADVEIAGWLDNLDLSMNRRTHKGKRHIECLEELAKRIDNWERDWKKSASALPDEEPMASKETIGELFQAVETRYGHDNENDVFGTVQTLLGFPEGLGAIDELTENQARTVINKCRAPNGEQGGQERLV